MPMAFLRTCKGRGAKGGLQKGGSEGGAGFREVLYEIFPGIFHPLLLFNSPSFS